MKFALMSRAVLCVAAVAFSQTRLPGAEPAHGGGGKCESVSQAVRVAVEKDPTRVLVTVEDFMVANESCACEIVKAAITGSRAGADMRKQIAVTATHVSPQMASQIADCVSKLAPEQAQEVTAATQKEAGVEAPAEQASEVAKNDQSGSDYALPVDIRSVYFIEPIASGATASVADTLFKPSSSKTKTSSHVTTKVVVQNTVSPHPHRPSALSPSTGLP